MISNYHTHTSFCDGNDTPEELIKTALSLGMDAIGFSGHSYTYFDESYCMSKQGTFEYKKAINSLKEKYKDEIKILLGVEQDYYSLEETKDYDFVIGSVHYIKKGKNFFPIDESKELLIENVNLYYNGDIYALIEDYYSTVADVYNRTKCDIVGHFDLITKFNENAELFDEKNPRYIAAYKKALESLKAAQCVFEVNFGAVAKGYRSTPYPSQEILMLLKKYNKKIMFSSDCHSKDKLLFGYDEYMKIKNSYQNNV